MNKENEEKLFTDFPILYQDHTLAPQQTAMCFGFECGDGWFKILYDLSKKLSKYPIIADQVKEKFGTLRFYCHAGGEVSEKDWETAYKLIDAAERKTEKTCERCGKSGKMNTKGWISVLCDKCRKEEA
jgi:hypothetical protein